MRRGGGAAKIVGSGTFIEMNVLDTSNTAFDERVALRVIHTDDLVSHKRAEPFFQAEQLPKH